MQIPARRFSNQALWTLVILACIAMPAIGQDSAQPTVRAVESRIAELTAAQALEEDPQRATAIELYKQSAELLKRANDLAAKAASFRALTEEAPQLLSSIREELRLPPETPTVDVPEGATLSQLEQSLDQATASLQVARQKLSELQAESARRDEQRAVLNERLVQLRQELADLKAAGAPVVDPEVPSILSDARAALYAASLLVNENETQAIQRELESYEARRELLPARRDQAQRRVSTAQALVEKLQALVSNKRKLEAERVVSDAKKLRREAARQHPILKAYAEESLEIANSLVNPKLAGEREESYAQWLASARAELQVLESDFSSVQTRLNASGLNRATGLLLRNQFEKIPDVTEIRNEIRSIHSTLEDLNYALIVAQEIRADAGDVDRVAQSLIARMPEASSEEERLEILQVARELASARRELLDKIIAEATSNLETLMELDSTLSETALVAQSFSDYIEERILWVRSVAKGREFSASELQDTTAWLLDPASWSRAWSLSREYVQDRLVAVSAGVLFLLLSFVLSIRCRRMITLLSERASRYSTDSFSHTALALLLTAVMASPIAITLVLIGWILRAPDGQAQIARSVGSGLYVAASYLYPLSFFRHLLRSRGLAVAHFKWSKDSALAIRKDLRWFTPTIVPIVALVYAIDDGGDEAANASLGRVLFTLSLVLLAFFVHRVLSPKGKVLARFFDKNKGKWIHRSRYIWYPLVVVLPLTFAFISWLGFHYTALRLQSRLEWTLILLLFLVTANEVLHRWLYVARRKVAVEDAKRRRLQAAAEQESSSTPQDGSAAAAAVVDEERVDLPALSEQTKQIFRTSIVVTALIGLFLIWAQALPALKMLDHVQIWPSVQVIDPAASTLPMDAPATKDSSSVVTKEDTSSAVPLIPGMGMLQADDAPDAAANEEELSVTAADVGFSAIILIATWIAFRNVPGLIEIVVLQRLPLDAGSRYALSTVIRYLIVVIGILIAFQAVGISWSNVQWLAAALTFGLAFGLQEIFANFVSGLIILAERPIRLGDTVTVGETSGTVMKIRMRATTITDWNRKELIIPNKTFITSDVINWSLTDPILRVSVFVGVSYSSDVDRVEKLLYKVAEDNKTVLADPKPTVIFKEFGDSTLNFEVRVFIPHIEYFVPVRHELHNAIYKVFKKEGIEIAFPQRDLNIRSIGELSELVAQRKSETKD